MHQKSKKESSDSRGQMQQHQKRANSIRNDEKKHKGKNIYAWRNITRKRAGKEEERGGKRRRKEDG